MLRLLVVGLTLLNLDGALADPTSVPSWSRFRGPNGSGQSDATTIPIEWTAQDYRWTVPLPGVGYSSPVVQGERVVITSAIEEKGDVMVLCLRTSDGKELWRRTFPGTLYAKHKFNSYASSTPALDEQRVYVTSATPNEYLAVALALEDGQEVWRRSLGPFQSEHGFGASPIVWQDLVIVPNDQDGASFIHALDRATGQTRWQIRRRTLKASFATPCIFQPNEGKPQLILSSWAHGITSLDPTTGESNWELPIFQNRVVGSPVIAAGLIFAAAGTGGVGRQFVAIRPPNPNSKEPPKVLYQLDSALPYVPTPVACNDLLFVWQDRGVVTCIEAPTGRVHWRERVGGDYFSSPVRVGERIYCISRTGEMVVLAASSRYKLLARFPLGERSHSTPAIAGGVMYLRTVSRLMALGGRRPD